ncbi:MAG: hypothetical protein D3911_03445 [Candidatus Electrothrix sp. AW3_4]|nr:hypothetical protein [Candidatus Electrothrix gigas]
MKIRTILLSTIAIAACYNTTTFALSYNYTTATNIIADGSVDAGEWSQADYQADGSGKLGTMYTQWSNGYHAGTKYYSGKFFYLLHNLEDLQTNEDADYNYFEFFDSCGNLLLKVWVFDDVDETNDAAWMTAAGLASYPTYPTINDTGFLVYNVALNQYRKYDISGSSTKPEDGGYDWNYYWGVYGAGGFNNSAFNNGLPLSINNNNEVYEIFLCSDCAGLNIDINGGGASCGGGGGGCGSQQTTACDPIGPPTSSSSTYFSGCVTPAPAPPTLVVLAGTLKATTLENSALIEWKTDMEVDNAGFNIWRSETKDGEYTKITESLIPAKGSGSQYIFTDDTVTTGNTYYYKVEDIDLNGTSTFHGPAVSSVTSEADHQLDVKRNAVISNVIDFKNVYIIIGCPEKQRVFVEQISYGIRNGSLIVNSLTGIKENGEPIVHNSENPAPQIKSFDELIGTKLHIDCVGKDLMVLEYNVLTDNFGNVQYDMLLKDEYGTKTHFFISNEYINARTTTEEISLASMPSCTLNAYTTCAPNPSCVGVCGAIQSTNLCGCIGAGTCDWKQIVQCDNIDCQVPKSCQYVSGPPPSCQCKESTLIGLRDFTVTMYDSSVLIEWKTDTEVDNAGFNIWRSETEDGEYIKITDSLIPAQGSGYQYFFTDDTVTEGKRYYYKLEDIDLYGASTFHGPVSTKRTHKGLLPAIRFLLRN